MLHLFYIIKKKLKNKSWNYLRHLNFYGKTTSVSTKYWLIVLFTYTNFSIMLYQLLDVCRLWQNTTLCMKNWLLWWQIIVNVKATFSSTLVLKLLYITHNKQTLNIPMNHYLIYEAMTYVSFIGKLSFSEVGGCSEKGADHLQVAAQCWAPKLSVLTVLYK